MQASTETVRAGHLKVGKHIILPLNEQYAQTTIKAIQKQ
jgi:hypothetical protein